MNKQNIIFESYPDFSGSSLEIYNALKNLGYNEKYNLIWAVDNNNINDNYQTINYFNLTLEQKIKLLSNTKLIVDSNRCIGKLPNNYRIYVRHGGTFKNCGNYLKGIGEVDAILTTSEELKEIDKQLFPEQAKDKFLILGSPATDRIFTKTDLYTNGILPELTKTTNKYNKIIGWLPTFRQHRLKTTDVVDVIHKYSLPTIKNLNEIEQINNLLQNKNILLIVQLHHAQRKNYENLPEYSNIKFINEELKSKYNITTYDLLSNFDALITDYSSVYNEFLLLRRPICLTVDDIGEYSKQVGFSFNYLDWIKGCYVMQSSGLMCFINEVSENIDSMYNEREKILPKFHKFVDNKATQRVIDYILSKEII